MGWKIQFAVVIPELPSLILEIVFKKKKHKIEIFYISFTWAEISA